MYRLVDSLGILYAEPTVFTSSVHASLAPNQSDDPFFAIHILLPNNRDDHMMNPPFVSIFDLLISC